MNYGSSIEENGHPKVSGLTGDRNLISKKTCMCVFQKERERQKGSS